MGKTTDDDGDGDIDDLCFMYFVKLFHFIIIRNPSAFSQQRFTPLRKPKLGFALKKHETLSSVWRDRHPTKGRSSNFAKLPNAKELTCT